MTCGEGSASRNDRYHLPVMPEEVIENLRPAQGEAVVDATVGGGGHAALILREIAPSGTLIGIDRDEDAIAEAGRALGSKGDNVSLVHGRMSEIGEILKGAGLDGADGILADFGVSSFQFDSGARGFSIRNDGPLDMRMDRSRGISARELISGSDAEDLERLFREYGEERHSRRIARALARQDIATTGELASAVEMAIPRARGRQRIHPATRVFQALRIAVNDELAEVAAFVEAAPGLLRPGGRLVIISYHSLEDRIVKRAFREMAATEEFSLPRRKATKPTDAEVEKNPRARSAKLRTLVRRAG
jgi:16S rRNA (cytosine1402-N4)-methyltransferase